MKYRKKPVVIEAFKWEGNMNNIPEWAHEGFDNKVMNFRGNDMGVYIETLEGAHYANVGDYIIQGIKGELYPCKPDIFEQTYDAVEDC